VHDVWQCTYAGEPREFHCQNTESALRMIIPGNAQRTKGYQCFSPEDYMTLEKARAAQNRRIAECAK